MDSEQHNLEACDTLHGVSHSTSMANTNWERVFLGLVYMDSQIVHTNSFLPQQSVSFISFLKPN